VCSRGQGLEIIFRVGMAILQYNQTDLIQLDMEGMSQVPPYVTSNFIDGALLTQNGNTKCRVRGME